jgi:peptidyl-tRNA hydrolase
MPFDESIDPIAMYLVVNAELEMSAGKLAAQCAHAAHLLVDRFRDRFDVQGASLPEHGLWEEWMASGYAKVVLAASAAEFRRARLTDGALEVRDEGRTELEPGCTTVVGSPPMRKSERPGWLKRLRLL